MSHISHILLPQHQHENNRSLLIKMAGLAENAGTVVTFKNEAEAEAALKEVKSSTDFVAIRLYLRT